MLCSANVVSTSPEVQNTTEPPPPGSKPASGKNTISRSNDDSGYSHTVMEDKGNVLDSHYC